MRLLSGDRYLGDGDTDRRVSRDITLSRDGRAVSRTELLLLR